MPKGERISSGFAPGRPISRVLSWAVISLGRRLPAASSGPPGARTGRAAPCRGRDRPCPHVAPAWPCSRWGLPGRPGHPGRRWSLTPPFHPYQASRPVHRSTSYQLPVTSLPVYQPGGLFLWPDPSGYPAWVLPSTVPCGARTFLTPRKARSATAWPTWSKFILTYSHPHVKQWSPLSTLQFPSSHVTPRKRSSQSSKWSARSRAKASRSLPAPRSLPITARRRQNCLTSSKN